MTRSMHWLEIALATTVAAAAQAPTGPPTLEVAPAFEVASIRISPQPFAALKTSPGRLVVTGASLSYLIQEAYVVSALQVAGVSVPGQFTIEAKAESTPTRSELLAMLQTLLRERFKLELHREMRELPVTALVLRKNAWKGTPAAAQDGDPRLGYRGDLGNGKVRSMYLTGESVTLPFMAKYVSGRLNRFVVDSTGLAGVFDFNVDVLIDAERAADRNVPERQVAEEIVTDLLEKLGLKLESRRAMVEVIVVDHAEQPSAN
jgi:uncharacterized protein (TIGR03435 family)